MKRTVKRISMLFMTLCIVTMTFAATNNDKPVPYERLPQAIKTFLTTHFPNDKMVHADKDWDGYDVILASGTDLEFTSKGRWTEIQMRQSPIPESILGLLPEMLTNHVKQTYPDKKIKEIVNKPYGYEIELLGMHDLELKFDKKGKFLYIDD